mgnify:CR=1 FL=1
MMWFPGITPMHCNIIKIQKMRFSGCLSAVYRRRLLPTRHCLNSMESRYQKTIRRYAQACQQFYDNGIKPYSLDLAEDWSAHEVIQTGAIGEFMSLDGIEWRSSAESASGDIAFDDALWKRIFSETNTFLKDSHFTSDDISVDINTATQMFLEGKAAMFHGYPALMQEFQEQMDAELIRIPFFHKFQMKLL